MRKEGGFTLIELLIVISIVATLVYITLVSYEKYQTSAIKTSVVSDLRNCISEIAISRQKGEDTPLPQIISNNCKKSKFTEEIILENEQPIKLRAEVNPKYGNIDCVYEENSGKITCSSPF